MAVTKSFKDTVNSILLKEGNSDTLKAGSGFKEPMHTLEKGKVPETENEDELVGKDAYTPDANAGTNTAGRKVSSNAKKDTSKSSKSPNPGEPMHKLEHQPQSEISTGQTKSNEVGSGPQKLSGDPPFHLKKSTQNKDGVNEDDELPETIDLDALVESMVEEGMSEEEITETIEAILEDYEAVDEEETLDEEVSEEESEEEELPEVEIPEMDIDVTEDVKAMFEGETFSEEFQAKAKTIFETAIRTRLTKYQEQLDEAFAAALVEATNDISENLAENVEDYLGYVVEQWIGENEVALEARLTTEWTQDFLVGLRNLMIENYMDIPEEKVDVVEELAAEVAALKEQVNEEIEINVALTKALNESQKWETFNELTDGLASTQVEKLKELVENVDFDDEETFTTKVQTLRESYFPSNPKSAKTLEKEIVTDDEKKMLSENNDLSTPMNAYVKTIGRTTKIL